MKWSDADTCTACPDGTAIAVMRDEAVNEQFLVEEIYERELALAEEYEREQRDLAINDDDDTKRDYGSLNIN